MKLLLLDTETSGLDPAKDKLVEIAVALCEVVGDHLEGRASYSSLHDPGVPIPASATKINKITDKMVAGKDARSSALDTLMADADYIVAFSAGFDRAFLPQVSAVEGKWLCALQRVNWRGWGYRERSLRYLSLEHQVAVRRPHRAKSDVHQLYGLLNCTPSQSLLDPQEGPTYLRQLLDAADKTMSMFGVRSRDMSRNQMLKDRGYRWAGKAKMWWTVVFDGLGEGESTDEASFLQDVFFAGNGRFGDYDRIPNVDDTSPEFRKKHQLD